jgi:hypothetical protein
MSTRNGQWNITKLCFHPLSIGAEQKTKQSVGLIMCIAKTRMTRYAGGSGHNAARGVGQGRQGRREDDRASNGANKREQIKNMFKTDPLKPSLQSNYPGVDLRA